MTKRQRTRFRFDAPEDDRSTDGIRFRPGRDFGEWLSEFGRIYGISRGETAKRLAICALKGFVAKDHFDLLDKLHRVHVEKYGPKRESFMLMCSVARKSLDAKFAEIDVAKITYNQGMNVTFVTSTTTDAHARTLLEKLGMPFRKEED